MTGGVSALLRLLAARAWFVACSALAAAGAVAAWPAFIADAYRPNSLAAGLGAYGLPRAAEVTRGLLFAGAATRLVVFSVCAVHLAWFGRDRVFPLLVGGGVIAYGVGVGLPSQRVQLEHPWLFQLNTLVAVGVLALATVTLPDGHFSSRGSDGSRRMGFLGAWLLTLWLAMYPVGLPWDGLRYFPVVRAWLHVVFMMGGLLAMASRYARLDRSARVQMHWVVAGIASGVAVFTLRLVLGGSLEELFTRTVYPVVVCCVPVALAVALQGGSLVWRLGDLLPPFIGRALFAAGVVTSSLLLGRLAVPLWVARGATPLGAVLACLGLSLVLAWLVGQTALRVLTYAIFPSRGDRERAIRLGVGALEDALTLSETLWALEGIIELGWPGSRAEVYREVIAGPTAFGSATLPPDALENKRVPIGDREKANVRWSKAFTLRVQGEAADEIVAFGQLRVIPPRGAQFTEEDLTLLQEVVAPLASALWRVQAMERLLARPPVEPPRRPDRPEEATARPE